MVLRYSGVEDLVDRWVMVAIIIWRGFESLVFVVSVYGCRGLCACGAC